MRFRYNVPYNEIIDSLLEIEGSCPTNMYKHTTRHNISRRQRNKIYASEQTHSSSLDIKSLMPYYNQAYGIKLKRGDSLFKFFYKYKKRNKGLVDRIIRQFDPEGIMPEEYNFTPVIISNVYNKFPNKNITSISLKFLLFFFEKIGIRNITVIDFSCGVVGMNRDENLKQGWTDSSSASSRSNKSSSLEIEPQLKEGEDETRLAHGKTQRRRTKKRQTNKRQTKKRVTKKRQTKKRQTKKRQTKKRQTKKRQTKKKI